MLIALAVLIIGNVIVGALLSITPDSVGKYIMVAGLIIGDILFIIGLARK